ncbi:MAG TPA: hypothetical protein VJL10_10670 [Anaerolineales bacterium]|nr:hypothetical protein [Anaerolineales bacterium]
MASNWVYSDITSLENLLLVDIDASFESQIDTWISTAEEIVNEYTGFTTASGLWSESITGEISEARVDGDLNLVIHPRKRPINSVSQIQIIKGTSSLTLELTNSSGDTRYTIPDPDWVIIYPNRELTISNTANIFIHSFSEVKFTRCFTKLNYIAGYTSIPRPVKHATTLITADIFMRQANKEGLSAITQGRVSKRWAERRDGKSDFTLDAEEILNHYKITSGWV